MNDLILILHPAVAHDLKAMLARTRWKEQNHKQRWEARYGRSYPAVEGEIRPLEGVKFIMSENIPDE